MSIKIYNSKVILQVNLDMTDSMGPGKLVRHMQNPSYTYDEYLICIGLGPSISSVICKNPSYSGPSYASSPVVSEGRKGGIRNEGWKGKMQRRNENKVCEHLNKTRRVHTGKNFYEKLP